MGKAAADQRGLTRILQGQRVSDEGITSRYTRRHWNNSTRTTASEQQHQRDSIKETTSKKDNIKKENIKKENIKTNEARKAISRRGNMMGIPRNEPARGVNPQPSRHVGRIPSTPGATDSCIHSEVSASVRVDPRLLLLFRCRPPRPAPPTPACAPSIRGHSPFRQQRCTFAHTSPVPVDARRATARQRPSASSLAAILSGTRAMGNIRGLTPTAR